MPRKSTGSEAPAQADITADLLKFIDASPSPFHTVNEAARRLTAAGFKELKEEDAWTSLPGQFFVRRNGSTLAAFRIPPKARVEEGFMLVGAHTDSPCLKLRSGGAFKAHGYAQWGIEVYGGVLQHTWLDRDLGVAGRLVLRDGKGQRSVTVASTKPLMRVANLAIHLNRNANEGIKFNPQTELAPILGLEFSHVDLHSILAKEAGLSGAEVLASELCLYPTQPAGLWGGSSEFIAAPRLDNLGMSHAALTALITSTPERRVSGIFLFDNEECGSESPQGAHSNFMEAVLSRVGLSLGAGTEETLRGLSRSFFVSADMAHAVHPNYADRHDPRHMPRINQGPVIKSNSSYRYATDAESSAAFQRVCERAGVPVQRFINRADLGCGSTIGPMTAAKLGLKTVDVGSPQLSMHSARECAGALDPALTTAAFSELLSRGI
ncbi:MAG: M18 family aminopeptidase [Planctomycetota bacterium]